MKRILIPAVLLFFATTLSVSAFAKSKSADVDVYQTSQVGNTTLKPGIYQVKINNTGSSSVVTFSQNGKQVASVTGQIVQLAKKSENTSITLDSSTSVPRIAQIDFEGQQTAVGLSSAANAMNTGE